MKKNIDNFTDQRNWSDKMTIAATNCGKCPDFKSKNCDAKAQDCMCQRCPRNLGTCLITRYCRETESIMNK